MKPIHMIIDHINAIGPVSRGSLLRWIRDQISDDDEGVLQAILLDGRVYSFTDDGIIWYTTKGQDPR